MPECQKCGGHVTDRFRRVFGANDGEVYGCHDCLGPSEIRNGAPANVEP